MSNIIFINMILIELALCLCAYMWLDEIINLYHTTTIYINIMCVCVLWLLHFGNKYYKITYRKPNDEIGIYRVIEFPSVWW